MQPTLTTHLSVMEPRCSGQASASMGGFRSASLFHSQFVDRSHLTKRIAMDQCTEIGARLDRPRSAAAGPRTTASRLLPAAAARVEFQIRLAVKQSLALYTTERDAGRWPSRRHWLLLQRRARQIGRAAVLFARRDGR